MTEEEEEEDVEVLQDEDGEEEEEEEDRSVKLCRPGGRGGGGGGGWDRGRLLKGSSTAETQHRATDRRLSSPLHSTDAPQSTLIPRGGG